MMNLNHYYENVSNWHSNIISSSRTYREYFKAIFAVLALICLMGAAALTVFFPKTGNLIVLQITISKSTKDFLTLLATLLGIFFAIGILPPLKKWYQPNRKRYRAAAENIIEQLKRDSIINEAKENRLKDIAARLLGAVEVNKPTVDPREMLLRASCELAKEMES